MNMGTVFLVSLPLLMTAVSSCVSASASGPENSPQAEPLVHLLRALRDEDLELFKTCYSAQMRDRIARQGWEDSFEEYLRLSREGIGGNPDPVFSAPEDELEITFSGDDDTGVLSVGVRGEILFWTRSVYPVEPGSPRQLLLEEVGR